MTTETKEIEIPLFSLGTYTPMDGEPVTFDEALLRQLEKNTNFVIQSKALQPPVGYDHPAFNVRDTDAHGRIVRTRYSNGVLFGTLANPSERLRRDAREFRRLAYSPEFHPNFKFTTSGKEVPVGPTVIGLAMLGKTRPAMKNPAHIPVSELGFGESVPAADAFMARQELRKAGLVAQTFDEGVYKFSEADIDPRFFQEPRRENEMDEKDVQRQLDEALRKRDEENERKLKAALDDQEKKFSEQIKKLSTDGARRTEVERFFSEVMEDKPRMGKIALSHFKTALMHPAVAANPDLEGSIKNGISALPSVIVGGTNKSTEKNFSEVDGGPDDVDGGDDNPLDNVTLKHMDNLHAPAEKGREANHTIVERALVAFSEKEPAKVKGLNKMAQLRALRTYVEQREKKAS